MKKASDALRERVGQTLQNKEDINKDHKIITKHMGSVAERGDQALTSTYLRAVMAFDRATKDSSYKITPQARTDYKAAVKYFSIANSKPIPEDKDLIQESLDNKEFSPQEMMRYFAKKTLYSAGEEKDNEATRTEKAHEAIQKDINAVYANPNPELGTSLDGSAPQASTPPVAIQPLASYQPDNMFFELDERGQQEYLENLRTMGDAEEANRLSEALAKKGGADKAAEENAGEVEDLMENPDFGHKKDDDDFKIEQGDIIEYLMKEVILKSTSWTINRICGTTGIISYELLAAAGKKAKAFVKPTIDKILDAPGKAWDKMMDKVFGPLPEDSDAVKKQKELCKKNVNDVLKIHEENRNFAKCVLAIEAIKKDNKEPENIKKFRQNIITHRVFVEADGVHYSDPNAPVKPFEDFCPKGASPQEVKILKETFISLQKRFDEEQIQRMINDRTLNKSPAEIKNWYNNFKQEKKSQAQRLSGPLEFLEAQKRAQDATIASLALEKELALLKAQTTLFAEEYATHKLLEKIREDPASVDLQDPNRLNNFLEQQKAEATAMFLKAEQMRGKGQKVKDENGKEIDVPSREELIDRASDLKFASREAFEKGKKTPVIDKNVAPVLDPSNARTQNPRRLIEEIEKDRTAESTITELQKNLQQSDKYLEHLLATQGENDERRKQLNSVKERSIGVQNIKESTRQAGVDGKTKVSLPNTGGRS